MGTSSNTPPRKRATPTTGPRSTSARATPNQRGGAAASNARPKPRPSGATSKARTTPRPAGKQAAQVRKPRPAPGRPASRQPVAQTVGGWSRFQPRVGEPAQRQRVLLVAVFVILSVFGVRLVYLQGIEGPALAATARDARVISGTLPADRGGIVDAEGTVLATSSKRFHIKVDQQLIATYKRTKDKKVIGKGPRAAAKELAPILGRTVPELAADLTGDNRGKYIAKNVLPETWRAIRALNVQGVAAEETTIREYPNGDIGGNIIGFVNSDDKGSAGIEQMQNELLTGTPGSYSMERARQGHQLPAGGQERTAAQAGMNVQLSTINDVQWKAQDAIDEAKRKTGASYGSIVIEDLTTGELLALAETDSVDPNQLGNSDPSTWGSRAVSEVFEPGSTAKVITMAAALETGVATPATQYVVEDRYTTANGQKFRDSLDHPVQQLTLAGIFAESSNTGTVQIGEQIPTQVRYDYLEKFGFGAKTGIGLPGESAGILHDVDDWDGRTKYSVLFGQGVAVNAVQANQVFATIGNGGLRTQPHLVTGYIDSEGDVTPAEVAEPVRVVSEKTANQVLEMMETVVEDGTGRAARIPGYRVAGKTGTAEAAAEGSYKHYVASFNGVAPADDPKLAVSVVLKYPDLEYGGVVAAPVFSDVTAFTLQYLKVPPSQSKPEEYPVTWE